MTSLKTGSVHPNNRPSPGPIGNTQGPIVPETSPNASGAGNSAPPPKPPEEKGWWQRWGSDAIHVGLDVVGLIPVVGEVADGANALIYLAEGDKVNAALSAASMLPVGGQAATAAKWGKKGVDAAQTAKTAGKAGAEAAVKSARETAGQAAKETAEAAAEKGAKSADNAGSGGHVKKSPEELAEAKKEQVKKNKRDGAKREQATEDELKNQYPDASVQREQYLRDKDGNILKDPLTGEARRVDHVVIKDGKVIDMVETTSKSADKAAQIAKENRILDAGGGYVRDRATGQTVPVGQTPIRIIRRD